MMNQLILLAAFYFAFDRYLDAMEYLFSFSSANSYVLNTIILFISNHLEIQFLSFSFLCFLLDLDLALLGDISIEGQANNFR